MSRIELKNINKYYGKQHILKNINLVAGDGDFLTLLGPSGCGKTTTLRVVAGLEKPETGTIYLDEKQIVNAQERFYEEPGKRGMDLVFQSYALWPHMNVFNNVAFGLSVKKLPSPEIAEKVKAALKRMRIEEYAKRYPSELSGGQQQRVAIARAIVSDSKVLLLDEPLSNLDAKLRVDMRSEIKRLHHDLGTTILYVTHDQVEALTMSTRIAIFFSGELEQVATPMELYQNPISLRVADFIGNPKINIIHAHATKENNALRISSDLGTFVASPDLLTDDVPDADTFDCFLGIRPEKIKILAAPAAGSITASVYSVQPAGSETIVNLKINDTNILVKDLDIKNYKTDQDVQITFDTAKVNVFAKDSGRLIKRVVGD
ncbi:ABC transporter, ATP-binding protein [Treponema socranskii subsp. socranskii VPI DR56BR1116 = ATCC 35536]|uniref:ABC transporter, ATP-binding protein n=1 Tax=Treponema socranskii subsp. socranskii VPI DR56BR1116 = ATCC 35536 TaxID=1125725 RepID=U2L9L5_TRESO|nr:ABC transporter ATP-binding protein [Treponema socranskii]ERF59383.1 ABC transporter, ATP-binding protein [Treponema socranskii subsp. socranskii VPI DR56BR1116 = ATCC 35536]ERK01178.1 ABC transporter, ATP-binding protein [Treponema socranskii subsp. socranskii VPI DR56BR1116 = ATCC 35536]